MITFLVLNSIAFFSGLILTSKLFKFSERIDNLLCFVVLFFAQIVFSVQILGLFGFLNLTNLAVLNAIALVVIIIVLRKQGFQNPKNLIAEFSFNKVIYFCAAFILGFTVIKSISTLINAPQGWDSLNYHFTFAIEWLKNANLVNPITISCDPTPTYYPINNCLYYFWLIAPFKSVFLADLGQLPFYIASFFAIFSICRKLDIDKELSFYAGALLLLTPNYFKQIGIGYSDIMAASMFLIALNFLIAFHKKRSFKYLTITGISLGLLLGTKTVSFTYCGILALPLVLLIIFNGGQKITFKVYSLLILFLSLALFGGYGYIRNLVQTGNPLYPLNFSLFGKAIFKGVMDAATYKAHWTSEDYNLSKLFFHEGMGIQLLLFIIPAIFIIYPLLYLKRKKIKPDAFLVYILSLPHILYINFRYIVVQLWTRFLYPFLGCGYILFAYIVEKLNINRKVIRTLVIICILSSAAEMGKRLELGLSFILSFSIFFLFFFKDKLRIKLPKSKVFYFTMLILAILILQFTYVNHEKYLYDRYVNKSCYWPDAAKAWKWINDNTKGSNIAYVGRPVPLPLYGSKFKNNVYYVSINKTHPAKLHYFENSEYAWGKPFEELHQNLEADNNYRGRANHDAWLKNLEIEDTDYLFVYSLHQTKTTIFPIEDMWAKLSPDSFKLVFSNGTTHIYKVQR